MKTLEQMVKRKTESGNQFSDQHLIRDKCCTIKEYAIDYESPRCFEKFIGKFLL